MAPLISIIVPVYNAELYIENTVHSVICNKSDQYELILVNDGSTDHSLNIINHLAEKDARIKIRTIENSGPAIARNIGMKMSSGKYIMFLDSDDMIDPEIFDYVIHYIETIDTDMIIFSFQIKNEDGNQDFYYGYDDRIVDTTELKNIFSDLYQNNLLNQIWGKIYSSDLLKKNSVTFSDYKYGEDRLFVFDAIKHCTKIEISKKCLYYYYIRSEDSLVTKFYDKKFEVCNLIDDKIDDLQKCCGDFSTTALSEINYMYLKSILSCEINLFLPTCPYSFQQKKQEIRSILNHEKVLKALKNAGRYGIIMNVILLVMRTKSIGLNCFMAMSITKISSRFPTFFIKTKHPQAVQITDKSGESI